MSEIKYDAFISYRHADLDSYAAKTLHRMLENFKVPKLADKEVQKRANKKINRIFRDRDELPVSNNLADSIKLALEAAEYLIVICSLRTSESLWVRKEIEAFIQMHGQKNVLAVLIEGEPQDSFPPELKQVKVQKPDENGQLQWMTESIEPLAADIRGKSKRQIHKLMKKEVLRLVAPMLGCSYDDLKQRHKEQRLRRMISIFAVVSTVLLAFGAFSTYQALQISKQSAIISQKSEELQQENDNNKVLQSKSLAKQALELYNDGDRTMGTLLALSALPKNPGEPERPYVAQAQEALTQTLQVYETGNWYKPYCLLAQEANIDMVSISPEGGTIAAIDEVGNLTVWNLADGQTALADQTIGTVVTEKAFQYLDENTLVYGTDAGLYVVDILSGKTQSLLENCYVCDMAVCEDKYLVAFSTSTNICVYDVRTNEAIFTYEGEEDFALLNGISLSPNGSYLTVGLFAGISDTPAQIALINLNTEECIVHTTLTYNWITEAQATNDGTCYVWNKDISGNRSFLASGPEKLYCLSTDGTEKWVYEAENTICHDFFYDENNLYSITGSNLLVISPFTGECINQIGYSNVILGYQVKDDGNYAYVYLQDGTLQGTTISNSTSPDTYLQAESGFAKYMAVSNENVIMQTSNKNLCLYKATCGSQMKTYPQTEGYAMHSSLNEDGSLLAIADYTMDGNSTVYVYDTKNTELLWNQELADQTGIREVISCADQKHVAVITYSDIYIYDWLSGVLSYHWTEESEGDMADIAVDETHSVLYVFSYGKCEILDLNLQDRTGEFAYSDYVTNGYVRKNENQVLYIDPYGCGAIADAGGDEQKAELSWQASLLDYSSSTDCYLIANTMSDEVQLYDAGSHTVLKSMSRGAATIEQLQFSPEGDKFYIQDLNHTIEVYDIKNFCLLKRMMNSTVRVGEWLACQDNQMMVLKDDDMYHQTGYLLNENLDVVATVPNLWEINLDGSSLFSVVDNGIYQFPIYSTQSLLDEAKGQLNGRELTEVEKEQYFVE